MHVRMIRLIGKQTIGPTFDNDSLRKRKETEMNSSEVIESREHFGADDTVVPASSLVNTHTERRKIFLVNRRDESVSFNDYREPSTDHSRCNDQSHCTLNASQLDIAVDRIITGIDKDFSHLSGF
jgi:hypothetical protein